MLFVAEQQHLKTMLVEVAIKMAFNGNGHDLLPKGQQLAKGHTDHLLAKINKKTSLLGVLVQSVICGSDYYIHGVKCNIYLD